MNNIQSDSLRCMPSEEGGSLLPAWYQLQSNKNKDLGKLVGGTIKLTISLCHLGKYLFKSTTYRAFPDSVADTSPYGRGAPFRWGPISPFKFRMVRKPSPKGLFLLAENLLGDKTTPPQINHLADKVTPRQTNHLAEKVDHPQTTLLADKTISSPINLLGDKITHASPISLSLDLGTQTGWALLSRKKILASGSENLKGDRFQSRGIRFLKFINFLDELFSCADNQLKIIFFEAVRRHLGVDAVHAYGGFLGHLTAWCEKNNIAYEGVPVGTIKRHATGKGNATKAMVIENMKQRGHKPIDGNEADALALGYWALDNRLTGL